VCWLCPSKETYINQTAMGAAVHFMSSEKKGDLLVPFLHSLHGV
jgi:hypothetical protein